MPPKPTNKGAKKASQAPKAAPKAAQKAQKGSQKAAQKATQKTTKKGASQKAVSKKGGKAQQKKRAPPPKKDIAPVNPWARKPRNYGVGGDLRPPMDVTRFTKWPRYVVLQRRKRILQMRLKVPPQINQFTKTLDSNAAANVLRLLNKYRPETPAAKKNRLTRIAKGQDKGAKPVVVKHGLNHVTKLVEDKKASFVVIAHDVEPIELVMFLPALCRKQNVPYCIIKGKARLGQVVYKKNCTALALCSVKPQDRKSFAQLIDVVKSQYNNNYDEIKRKWGGGQIGLKSQAVLDKRLKQAAIEDANKRKYLQAK